MNLDKTLNFHLAFGLCLLIVGFMCGWGYIYYKQESVKTYAAELEGENKQLKIDSIQKDLDYLNREQCKHISMRVINMNNEVKDVQFVCMAMSPENQKYITIVVDGYQKNFDYTALMSKVFSVECGDDFKW